MGQYIAPGKCRSLHGLRLGDVLKWEGEDTAGDPNSNGVEGAGRGLCTRFVPRAPLPRRQAEPRQLTAGSLYLPLGVHFPGYTVCAGWIKIDLGVGHVVGYLEYSIPVLAVGDELTFRLRPASVHSASIQMAGNVAGKPGWQHNYYAS
ncbi:uncharacterized protein BO96DRAFT_353174 [Aspergillus niger CBS 101883]|uniref:Uncharacterized protein n=3 Tax=Aspergillus niger TaxID=5061 RepID=A2R9U7_ASPNC|nr:uncharacterized protein BO96DRAFT_353174 [Aspergillus niger CBS 101883]XP_059602861.1 hypothetical protein An18g00270 [Aspergillus niger]PYH50189.1 hypothetical protein BO96DRAFT_353174 [Aspergillus niger CBS 101883]RDH14030.1 hypothetical protein M747DRAFT_319881 [Aspergillus niger ATCC 13496]CAK43103.1 hypothetical protein An18g00270 [Aspergillus niger]